jgi:hypothetical protein
MQMFSSVGNCTDQHFALTKLWLMAKSYLQFVPDK